MQIWLNTLHISDICQTLDDDGETKGYNDEFEYIKKIVESYDELAEEEQYKLLGHFFNLEYVTKDIIDIVNYKVQNSSDMHFCEGYTRLIDIPTNIETESVDSEGVGKDLSWWAKKRKLILVCAARDKFKLTKVCYSSKEIRDLIKGDYIYPINGYGMDIKEYSPNKEDYQKFDYLFNTLFEAELINSTRYSLKPKNALGIKCLLWLINSQITRDDILEQIKMYLGRLIKRMEEYPLVEKDQLLYDEIIEFYNKHFKNKVKEKTRS